MDICGIARFHNSVHHLPVDGFNVPIGGLHRFLKDDLRAKVFLIGIGVFEDRWAMRTPAYLTGEELYNIRICMRIVVDHIYYAARLRQNELRSLFSRFNTPTESAWMFHLILVLLHCVGFDGDDGPVERGFGPMQIAIGEAEFLLRKASESYMILHSPESVRYLDYEEYDPHRTVEAYFTGRHSPSSYKRIVMRDAPPPCFDSNSEHEHYSDIERVVEVTLVALAGIERTVEAGVVTTGSRLLLPPSTIDKLRGELTVESNRRPSTMAVAPPNSPVGYYMCHSLVLDPSHDYTIQEASNIIHQYLTHGVGDAKPHLVVEKLIRPAIFLLKKVLCSEEGNWVHKDDLSFMGWCLIRQCVATIVDVLRFNRRPV
ncbi:hypothetical protein FB451DRAFT_1171752 [Mycena latifolia]|nr:hypothetical protein FB451DRAFT_1171752 [Mycena latifolia]